MLDKLPAEYDARVKAMEVDERPTEEYSDVGGLDKQIQELIEAIGESPKPYAQILVYWQVSSTFFTVDQKGFAIWMGMG